LPPQRLRNMVLEVLETAAGPTEPPVATVQRRWEQDGARGELLSWDLGYGPPTEAYLLTPTTAAGPLPGVVALHCHSGFKWYGKEKIADGPDGPAPGVAELRSEIYGSRAYANQLAKEGFVVLVHDVFMWGSRRFDLHEELTSEEGTDGLSQVSAYNRAAATYEHVAEKYCRLLGTTLAAVVSKEDRAAAAYLASRPEVRGQKIGCIGLSGGGLRAGMLHASSDLMSATVIVGMMATYPSLLADHVACHTWMLFPSGWPDRGDWPDLVGCRPSTPLLVQYDRQDQLFPPEGMRAAHEKLARHYGQQTSSHGWTSPGRYQAEFYPGGHKFDGEMQGAAFAWLKRELAP
jgi:dienelactone hydrolase